MATHHYPAKALIGDYVRGLTGVLVTGGLLGFATIITVVQYLFAVAALLFAGYLFRTWQRHRTSVTLDDTGIIAKGPFGTAIRWPDISDVRLRYFSTRRDRKSGWFQLNIRSAAGRISIDSALSDFDEVLASCAAAARNNRLELSDVTCANFAAAGHPVDATTDCAVATQDGPDGGAAPP